MTPSDIDLFMSYLVIVVSIAGVLSVGVSLLRRSKRD